MLVGEGERGSLMMLLGWGERANKADCKRGMRERFSLLCFGGRRSERAATQSTRDKIAFQEL